MHFVRRNHAWFHLVLSFVFGLLSRDAGELREGFVEVLGACSVVWSGLFAIIVEVASLYIHFALFRSDIWSVLCVLIRPCNSYTRDKLEINVRAVKLAEVRIDSEGQYGTMKLILFAFLAFAAEYLRSVFQGYIYASLNLLAPELFFLILAHLVYKMWIIREPNTLELWNKLDFEEKKRRVYTMFKIFSTYICWINI